MFDGEGIEPICRVEIYIYLINNKSLKECVGGGAEPLGEAVRNVSGDKKYTMS